VLLNEILAIRSRLWALVNAQLQNRSEPSKGVMFTFISRSVYP